MLHTNILVRQMVPIIYTNSRLKFLKMTLIDDYISGLSPLSYVYFNR